MKLSPSRFEYDTGRLLKVLDTTLAEVRTAQDDAAAISTSVLRTPCKTQRRMTSQRPPELPEVCSPERLDHDKASPSPFHESTSAHSKTPTGDEGKSRKNVSLPGRSRTLRRL